MAVLLTEFSGDQPATATFNLGEKKGAAQVDFAPVMPDKGAAQWRSTTRTSRSSTWPSDSP